MSESTALSCPAALNRIQAFESASWSQLRELAYSEPTKTELEANVKTVASTIAFLNQLISDYGKSDCPQDISEFSLPRRQFAQRACEDVIFQKGPLLYPDKSICEQKAYEHPVEKYKEEGCDILSERILSGKVALLGSLEWLSTSSGVKEDGFEMNVRAQRSLLEQVYGQIFYYAKMKCDVDVQREL